MRRDIFWLYMLSACLMGCLSMAHKAEKESEQFKVDMQKTLNEV